MKNTSDALIFVHFNAHRQPHTLSLTYYVFKWQTECPDYTLVITSSDMLVYVLRSIAESIRSAIIVIAILCNTNSFIQFNFIVIDMVLCFWVTRPSYHCKLWTHDALSYTNTFIMTGIRVFLLSCDIKEYRYYIKNEYFVIV